MPQCDTLRSRDRRLLSHSPHNKAVAPLGRPDAAWPTLAHCADCDDL